MKSTWLPGVGVQVFSFEEARGVGVFFLSPNGWRWRRYPDRVDDAWCVWVRKRKRDQDGWLDSAHVAWASMSTPDSASADFSRPCLRLGLPLFRGAWAAGPLRGRGAGGLGQQLPGRGESAESQSVESHVESPDGVQRWFAEKPLLYLG